MRHAFSLTCSLAMLLLWTGCATPTKRLPTATNKPATPLEKAINCSVSLVIETDNGDSYAAGVLLEEYGQVLTVHHAVADAKGIVVVIDGGQTTSAHVIAADPISDIAILQTEGRMPSGLTPVAFATRKPEVGEETWSIGNPFGTSRFGGAPSVSAGIVSAVSRSYFNDDSGRLYLDSIQHDAPTNPGNSGGGVFNSRGELLGLNALITTSHENATDSGVAFAIPADQLQARVAALQSGKTITHGWFGEELFMQATENYPTVWGRLRAVFGPMAPNGPGAERGILSGDVVIKINGKDVFGLHEVLTIEDSLPPGQTVEITVARGEIQLPIGITVGERPWRE
ncbi:S1C family serine protease [Planctomycetota bacterium]|nr:S1C family serine protease [Planctomycetota bacterium]